MLAALGYVWVYYWQQKMRRFGRQDLFDDKTADALPCLYCGKDVFLPAAALFRGKKYSPDITAVN